MFVVTQSPERDYRQQSERRGHTARRSFVSAAARADLLIDQRKQRWHRKAENQHDEKDGLVDVDDVPRIPALGKRPKRAYAIAVGVIEQNVAEACETGIGVEQSPARRKIRVASFAAAQAPDSIHERDDRRGDDWHAEERMRESAMVIEGEGRSAEPAEDIAGGSLSGGRERG